MRKSEAENKANLINRDMLICGLSYRFEAFDISDNEDTSTWGKHIIALVEE